MKFALGFFAFVLSACVGENEHPPLKTAPATELSALMGSWHVLEVLPTRFEIGCSKSLELYELRKDGVIDVTFTCEKDGEPFRLTQEAQVKTPDNTTWEVLYRLWGFIPLRFPYVVVDHDPKEGFLVVGYPSREYVWIMARAPSLPETTLEGIRARLREQGYDLGKLEKVPQ